MTVLTERVFGSIFEHFFKLAGTCVGRSAFCQGCILLEILDSCRVLDALISISTMDNIGIHVLVHPEFHVLLFQYQPWLILNFISLFIRPCIVLDVLNSILTMVNIEIPFH